MKFTEKDYKNLLGCIEAANIDLIRTKRHYLYNKKGNNPEIRFVWYVFWASKYSKLFRDDCDQYLDSHILMATKKAIDELIKIEV